MNIAVATKIAAVALEKRNRDKAEDIGSTKKTVENKTLLILLSIPIIGAILLLGIAISMTMVMSWTASFANSPTSLAGPPTQLALKEVKDLDLFRQAQERYGVSWSILAAIANIESTFGTYPNGSVSSCGAVGYMQFLPTTWSGNANPTVKDDPSWRPGNGQTPYETNPDIIAKYGGYGTDANGDGKADPYDPIDAIFSAAVYLKANYDPGDSWENAIYAYNHDRRYVRDVMELASTYQMYQSPSMKGNWPTPPGFAITAYFGQVVSSSGQVLWSGGHQGIDIGCPDGTPLYTSIPGEVHFAGYTPVYGNCVKIWNPLQQTMLVYGHLSEIAVRPGQPVQQGQVIGLSGHSGRAFGAHLHFEVQVGGQLCDPMGWLTPESLATDRNY